jgi:TonB family protein
MKKFLLGFIVVLDLTSASIAGEACLTQSRHVDDLLRRYDAAAQRAVAPYGLDANDPEFVQKFLSKFGLTKDDPITVANAPRFCPPSIELMDKSQREIDDLVAAMEDMEQICGSGAVVRFLPVINLVTMRIQMRRQCAMALSGIEPPPLVPQRQAPPPPVPQMQVAPNTRAASQQQAMLDWNNQIKELLNRKAHYPSESVRRHEEGIVTVGFTLDRNGRVMESHIQQSSGFPTLDREVLNLVNRVQPFPPIPSSYEKDSINVSSPLKFSLSGPSTNNGFRPP